MKKSVKDLCSAFMHSGACAVAAFLLAILNWISFLAANEVIQVGYANAGFAGRWFVANPIFGAQAVESMMPAVRIAAAVFTIAFTILCGVICGNKASEIVYGKE